MRSCFSGGTASRVRMLCRRSASLIRIADVARRREQHLPEVLGLRVLQGRELDAVDLEERRPPALPALPKRFEISALVVWVSSTVSWSSAAMSAWGSRCHSARMWRPRADG